MAHKFQNKATLKRKLAAMSPAVRETVPPVMAAGAGQIVDMQQALAPENKWPTRDKPWQQPGTMKRAINWIWSGPLRITIRDKPPEMPNLGLWTEKGTEGHTAGSYRDRKGHRRNAGARGHAATKAQPFFFPAVRAYAKPVGTAIRKAMLQAIQNVTRQ
jgi:hypothetical protein